jgi:hypothetical protein
MHARHGPRADLERILKRDHRASVTLVIFTLAVLTTAIIGNLVQTPVILLLWGVAVLVITLFLVAYQNQPGLLRWAVYIYDNVKWARKWKATRNADEFFIRRIKVLNKQVVCIWIKDDDVS